MVAAGMKRRFGATTEGAASACRNGRRNVARGAAAFLLAALSANADRPYHSAAILSPADDEALRANGGQLTVSARIVPALRPGHRLQLLLDGTPKGRPQTSAQFHLTDVDRGTHRLRVRILDAAAGVVFVGKPSQFHLLRHSIRHPGVGARR